ncbi:hypothetical protein Ddye_015821 [Dipteronia dyeriana]|uniref:Protein TIME FOR COFFEE n=1 Tax=Dipteronia dyeriana TaxID=168575 RepID=A0AAD9WZN6_9ROSI|nr:hypothetical protein Ddye_015821 [Dipteronia dyeriana]
MKEGSISMDRSREARRSNQTSANGLSRRRQRSSSLRDSHEEDGQMELQDTARLRDRAHQRDRDRYRDREFSNHHKKIQNKRRRGDSLTQENNREEGESTEGSVADEEECEIEERRSTHINSHNTAPFSSSLSNHRKNLPPTRPFKQAPAVKATDEMIEVLVPRKARSASVKRSHENWVSGNGGFWEDHRVSTSTASRSAEANSPSSSNVSVRKKMKPNGPKTRLPKASESSSSVQQDDIEIEIAEVLFGLMKQSQNSKNEDDNTRQKLESKDVKPSVSVLAQNNRPAADLLLAPKKSKVEADKSSNPGENISIASPDKFECELPEKMENSSAPESQKSAISCEASQVLDTAKESVESQEEATKQGDSKLSIEGSGYTDGPVTERNPVSDEKESALCAKIGDDLHDSTVTKANWTASERESRKEEKFKIDLMALPPMASSPDRDGFNDFSSDPNLYHVNMKSDVKDENVKKAAIEEHEEKKIEPIGESRKMKFDLEKPNKDNGRDSITNKLQNLSQKQPQQPSKSTIPKVEKAHSSSVPLQIAIAGWANGVPQMGYMPPPFQAIVPMDGSARSAAAQQPPQFVLSQPRPKRCTTHHYIARNISLNQQLAKMNHFSPVGAGSAPLRGGKPSSINVRPSTENPLQGSLPVVNLNSVQDKGQATASFPVVTQKVKCSEGVNVTDPAQRKQFVLQQAPQPASAGNFLHAPAFIFPVSQQQAAITGAANQSGPSKSTTFSSNSTAAFPASSTSLPSVAAAVSYNYPNMTIVQNNGYPFPVPTPIGAPPAIRGSHSQALPYFNGSFYASQFFHPPQLQQQQQPNSQPLIQAHQNTNTSSASSSSYKQPQSQQPRGMPVSGSNILSSTSMQQPQQSQKQHVPPLKKNRKLEAEMSGENTPSLAESRISHNQTSTYGQNFSVPLQPLNYALMPSSAVSGSNNGGNHGEKQQQSQQKNLKGGVELIPQAFAMSYASFSGSNNTGSNLSFSSMPQNPAIFQSQGYQVAPAAQAAQQKNHQMSEMKTGGGSSNHDDSKKTGLGKSATTNGQTLVFDNPARTLNFVSTPFTGNWPSRAITQTAQVASNSQNFHQNQLLQHQKQMLQQSRSKPQTSNSRSSSSIAAKHSNNGSIFPQTIVSSQSPQWKNSTRTPTSQVPPTPVASSNVSNHKNVPQQQVRSPQGQTQISFERNSKSGVAPQGQQIPTSNQSPSPSGGNLITCSTGSKAGSSIPTLQSQQPENSSASTGQKSSPVCGRNVPSILSTRASQLSELKY